MFIFRLIALTALAASPGIAAPATPAARPATVPAAHAIEGFRSAQFGMDEAAVRAAAAHDFGIAPASLIRKVTLAEGVTILEANLPQLDPGPGAATVQYVLGARSARLMHINVLWDATDDGDKDARVRLIGAGLKLARYFKSYSWAPGKALADLPLGDNSVVLFAAQDADGASLELRADNIAFTRQLNGKTVSSVQKAGPSHLRLAYDRNPADQDVALPARGAF
ncbi:MAG: hypothetical protein ABI240_11330 [Sphingomonas sp.]